MLNTELKTKMFITPCIKNCSYLYIVRPCEYGNGALRCVITFLTDDEEEQLDAGETITIKRPSGCADNHDVYFVVNPKDCYGYGDLKFDGSNNDLNDIEVLDWFRKYYVRIFMPSEYNYEDHTVISDLRGGRWFDTNNPKVFLPYMYACLDKPEKVVIFREYLDPIYIRERERKERERRERKKRERKKKKKFISVNQIDIAKQNKYSRLTIKIK